SLRLCPPLRGHYFSSSYRHRRDLHAFPTRRSSDVAVETTYHGVAVAPRVGGPGTSSSEIDDRGRQGIVEGFTLYGPIDMDVTYTDRVRWRGVLFDVVGEPGPWRNPMSGRPAGVEAAIRRSQG